MNRAKSSEITFNQHSILNPREVIFNFYQSLFNSYTYSPHKNIYSIFGFLWGLPIPFFSFFIAYINQPNEVAFHEFIPLIINQPIYWWLILHPIIFGIVFGAIGTMANIQFQKNENYIELLQTRADTDGLTGLFNHRYFQSRIREEANRSERMNQSLALVMIDIDHFKRFNDNYGHPIGDSLLKKLAQLFEKSTRPYDICCRYGGEEFAIILPDTDIDTARQVCERIRVQVESCRFDINSFQELHITVSVGIAVWNRVENISNWISRTDQNLYLAKESGRNCVQSSL